MIANSLNSRHYGKTLLHEKRRYCIENVEHHKTYVLVRHLPVRGRNALVLPLSTEVEVSA
jgi:hypothetical protein